MAQSPLYGSQARRSEYRDRLAAQLIGQGSDSSPVQHWTQGAARLAQALAGGMIGMKQDQRADERQKAYTTTMQGAMSAQDPQAMIAALSGNQDTAPQALAMQQQLMSQRAAEANRGTWKPTTQNGLPGQVHSLTNEFKPDPMPRNPTGPQGMAAEYEYAVSKGFKGSIIDYQREVANAKRPPEPAAAPAGPAPAFPGSGMQQQLASVLLDPNIPPTDPRYHWAYAQATAPQERFDPALNQVVTIRPQIPPTIRQPVYPGQGGTPQAQPVGQTPDAGVGPGGQAMPSAQPPQAPMPQANAPQQVTPTMSVQQVGPPKPKELTEGQALSAGFADRMTEAQGILNSGVDTLGADPMQRAASAIPGAGNYMVSEDFQKFEQAKRNFINAQLRRESGATIQDSEFLSAEKQYFPQPGDSPALIEQKRKTRESAIAAMRRAGGNAYNSAQPPAAPTGGGAVADAPLPPMPEGFRPRNF